MVDQKWGGRANGTPPRIESVPVLIVLHSDGYVECYGPRHVDAHIELMPKMPTCDGEIMAEEFITLTMPRRHRQVYMPGMVRAAKNLRIITPHEIAENATRIDMLRAIDAVKIGRDSEVMTWTL